MSAIIESPPVVAGQFIQGMPEDEYHAHPALSSTGMKNLLRSPKYFRMMRTANGHKPEFDIGHAVHARVLGVGLPVVEIPHRLLASNGALSTKAAKDFVEQARAEGKVPLKPDVYARVIMAADAILTHPKARDLMERPGFSEVSLFVTDPDTDVQLRARVDRLAGTLPIDVKSTNDVRRRNVERVIVDFGYDVQAATYRHVLRLVLGVDPEPMHLIFTEKDPPYEVRVVRLADPAWQAGGEEKMRAAIDLFAWCTERGQWPGDDEDGGPIEDLPAPGWYRAATSSEVFL